MELLITILVFIMAGCFFAEMSHVQPPASGVLKGMFVPKLSGEGAVGDAIALLGALIMPYAFSFPTTFVHAKLPITSLSLLILVFSHERNTSFINLKYCSI